MDASNHKISEQEALRMAQTDYLTGLANRRALYDYYNSLPKNTIIHAMFMDIDNFKRVNDIYGHSMGDNLLVCIGELIQSHVKGFVSRIGGDEFVVLIEGYQILSDLEDIAQSVLADMANINFRKDIQSLISLSIGIVQNQNSCQSLDEILNKCDASMYQAKYNGKNCFIVYQENDHSIEISKNLELEMDEALMNGDFKVYLQPKVNMVTLELYGAEALSRWVHPIDGVRPPSVYIPLFEKNGFIAKLDLYIFKETCRLKALWISEGRSYAHIPISVNMSRLHLYNSIFPDQLEAIAQHFSVPTCELELEITEGVFIKDNAELIRMVDLLQGKGFMISIDDFGSGFSALNLLKDIPANTIKIDKEFLHSTGNDFRGKKIIKNVIGMCKDLKYDVVTEGIETKEQADFIMSCGCQIAQGFLYSKPLAVDDFTAFAEEYAANVRTNYHFPLDGKLESDDGVLTAEIIGDGITVTDGIFKGSKAYHLPGGPVDYNTIHIPLQALSNDSFTLSLWIRPFSNHEWTSAIYVKFESGFASMIPMMPGGMSDFRIRDSKELTGWYDITGCPLHPGDWVHFVISYNAKTEKAVSIINGEVVGMMDNVATNRYVKLFVVGGDLFQQSFEGDICELRIYNEPKDYDFIKELHFQYILDPRFNAFPIGD